MDPKAETTIIQKDSDLSMASCGYPDYVAGVFDDRKLLICTPTGVVRDPGFFLNAKGIKALTGTEALSIDRRAHTVTCRNGGAPETIGYDKLILAAGALLRVPPVPGTDLEGITTLHTLKDADYLRRVREEGKIKKAVVVGGGRVGMETCKALHLAGIQITVVEMLPQILTFLDWRLARLLENHVKSKAADVLTDVSVAAFLGEGGKLSAVKLSNGAEIPCQLAVIAAGDCGEATRRITGARVHAPFGDLATADLPYAPPFSLAIDNLIATAHVLENKMKGRMRGTSAEEVRRKLDQGEKPFLLDCRGPDEFEAMRLGIGETLIPLGALRRRLSELPADKDREIVCFCKISLRGYEAALTIEAAGYTTVKVMEGGILARPYPREK